MRMSTASSPCIGICTIDEPSALCLGCGRTIDEIVGWGRLSEPQRIAVMAELPMRLGADRIPALEAGTGDP
jgi:hypothetical protein